VDIRDPFQREWALAWRVQPHRDIFTITNTAPVQLDPSAGFHDENLWEKRSSKICIDATKPWPEFPDVSLPPQKYLDRVADQWERYGLNTS
jgi:3-polyprenyl-4-hydroxybenzoate decarboxylase